MAAITITAIAQLKRIKKCAARDWPAALTSGAPKIFKSLLAQFRIAGRMLNSTMAQPVLNCPCIMPRIGQRVAAGVLQHVDVNLEWEARALADALD